MKDKIVAVEKKFESEIYNINHKNDVINKELKEIKIENQEIKSKFHLMEKEIEAFKEIIDKRQAEINVLGEENETVGSKTKSSISCEKCEFIAKSEAGLKTHDTVKHKTSLMRAYTKVSR